MDSLPLIPIVPVTGSLPTSPPLTFVTPEPPQAAFELPASYGDDKIALLVRDPWWVYAYWEVTPERERQVVHHLESLGAQRMKEVAHRVYNYLSHVVYSSPLLTAEDLKAERWQAMSAKDRQAWRVIVSRKALPPPPLPPGFTNPAAMRPPPDLLIATNR